MMLENSRMRQTRHQKPISHSLPNFHYSNHPQKNPEQPPPTDKPIQSSLTHNQAQSCSQYQTGQALRRYANTLLQNSPYNRQSTYHRYYTEPDQQLNDEYNQYNGVRFYGHLRLGNRESKFNRFQGATTYKESYGAWNSKANNASKLLTNKNNAVKSVQYSHYYGNQTPTKQIGPQTNLKFHDGKAPLQTQTEYRKNYKNPQQKPLIRRQQKTHQSHQSHHHKSVSDFTNQVPWLTKVTNLNNIANKRYSQPNQEVMDKYYLSVKNVNR